MTLNKASDCKVLTNSELMKLSSSADKLLGLIIPHKNVTTATKSLVQCIKNSHSSYGDPSQKACVTNIAEDLVSCRCVQGALD